MKAYPLRISPYNTEEEFLNNKITSIKDLCDFFNAGVTNCVMLEKNKEWVYNVINHLMRNSTLYFEDIFEILRIYFSKADTFRSVRSAMYDSLYNTIIALYGSNALCIKYSKTNPIDVCYSENLDNPAFRIITLMLWLNPMRLLDANENKEWDSETHADISSLVRCLEKVCDLIDPIDIDIVLRYRKNLNEKFKHSEINLATLYYAGDYEYIIDQLRKGKIDEDYVAYRKALDSIFKTLYTKEGRGIGRGDKTVMSDVLLSALGYSVRIFSMHQIEKKYASIPEADYLISDLYEILLRGNISEDDRIAEITSIRKMYSHIPYDSFMKILLDVSRLAQDIEPDNNTEELLLKVNNIANIPDTEYKWNPYCGECSDDPDKDITNAFIELETICNSTNDQEVTTNVSTKFVGRNKLGKVIISTASEASSTDKSMYKADKRIKGSQKLHETQAKGYKLYKTFKTNEDKIDSQLTKIARSLKDKVLNTDKNKARDELIEGSKWTVFGVLKKVLAGAALFSVSKVATIILLVTRFYCGSKVKASEKKKVIEELREELAMVDEKIQDAQADGDRKAKYELMRIKNSLNAAVNKITSSYRGSPDAGLAEARKVLSESRASRQ